MTDSSAIEVTLEALYDASEEDRATAGPDLLRGIFPTVKLVNADGIHGVDDDRIRALSVALMQRKGG